jgi:hypothetical protein
MLNNAVVIFLSAFIFSHNPALLYHPVVNNFALKSVQKITLKDIRLKEENKKIRFETEAVYPELKGLTNPVIQKKINNAIKNKIGGYLNSFKKDALDFKADYAANPTIPTGNSSIEISYSSTFLNAKLLSLNFIIYTYYLGAAHPNSEILTLNYDLQTGKQIFLSDIFQKNSGYLKKISDYSISVLKKRFNVGTDPDMAMIREGASAKPENYKSFNLTGQDLVVIFQDYQVAPHVAGPQEVKIPLQSLKNILNHGFSGLMDFTD